MIISPSSLDTNLSQLLDEVNSGKTQLPEFQRDWTWDDNRIRGIIASLSQGYPMGAIMRLQYGNPDIKFKYRTIKGVGDRNVVPDYLVLDGQQRLTSIYQALYSANPVETKTEKGKEIKRFYYLSMEKLLSKCENAKYVYSSHNEIMVNFSKLEELRDVLDQIRRGILIGKEVSGTTYNYYGDPQPLLKYQFDDFYVIVDAASMEVRNRTRLALEAGDYTCYIIKEHEIFTSHHRGVKPLLDWIDAGTELQGGIAADKVIGKAAAFLYVLLGVSYVYAGVISKPALGVFEKYGIECEYGTLVEAIENRTKDGFCPMESAVWNVEEPEGVPKLLKAKLQKMAEEAKYRESLKAMPICQIEDARAEIVEAQEVTVGELDLEKLRVQMEALDAEYIRTIGSTH